MQDFHLTSILFEKVEHIIFKNESMRAISGPLYLKKKVIGIFFAPSYIEDIKKRKWCNLGFSVLV